MLSPAVTRRLIAHVTDSEATARRDRANGLLARLTEREKEVAVAIAQGKPNAEIGADLFMSIGTVKAHVTQVLMKLELENRVQIALLAHDAGLAGG
jgi:DNA-binding NarL/FixJ family response regulator